MNIKDIKNFLENEILLKQLNIKSRRFWQFNINKPILKQILNKYNWLRGPQELIYLLKNKSNLESLHIFCPVCGKKNKFRRSRYTLYCSLDCAYKSPSRSQNITKTKLINIDINGLNSIQRAVYKLKNILSKNGLNGYQRRNKKSEETKLKRYGNKNFNNSQKSKKTKLSDIDKNGLNSYQRTVLKCKQTKQERYNDSNYNNRIKYFNTKQKRYGDKNYNNRSKMKNTCKIRFGVDNYSKTKEFKDLWKDKDFILNFTNKVFNTKKKNGTLGTSNDEDMIYQFLIYKFDFDDIIHHYKDKRYPFECDFYIKSLDLFIELNFFWTHGKESFDKNNKQHLQKLNDWKLKSEEINFKQNKKDAYKNAIYIWTINDPLKLQTFKQNNLNYKIFYNLGEFLDWFQMI